MTYISSAPYISGGLNEDAITSTYDPNTGFWTHSTENVDQRTVSSPNTLTTLVNGLMNEAAQRLFDMHATSIVGNKTLNNVFGATA